MTKTKLFGLYCWWPSEEKTQNCHDVLIHVRHQAAVVSKNHYSIRFLLIYWEHVAPSLAFFLFPMFSPSLPSITDVCLTSVHQSGSLAVSRNIYFLGLGRRWCTSDISTVSLHNRNVKGLRWNRGTEVFLGFSLYLLPEICWRLQCSQAAAYVSVLHGGGLGSFD